MLEQKFSRWSIFGEPFCFWNVKRINCGWISHDGNRIVYPQGLAGLSPLIKNQRGAIDKRSLEKQQGFTVKRSSENQQNSTDKRSSDKVDPSSHKLSPKWSKGKPRLLVPLDQVRRLAMRRLCRILQQRSDCARVVNKTQMFRSFAEAFLKLFILLNYLLLTYYVFATIYNWIRRILCGRRWQEAKVKSMLALAKQQLCRNVSNNCVRSTTPNRCRTPQRCQTPNRCQKKRASVCSIGCNPSNRCLPFSGFRRCPSHKNCRPHSLSRKSRSLISAALCPKPPPQPCVGRNPPLCPPSPPCYPPPTSKPPCRPRSPRCMEMAPLASSASMDDMTYRQREECLQPSYDCCESRSQSSCIRGRRSRERSYDCGEIDRDHCKPRSRSTSMRKRREEVCPAPSYDRCDLGTQSNSELEVCLQPIFERCKPRSRSNSIRKRRSRERCYEYEECPPLEEEPPQKSPGCEKPRRKSPHCLELPICVRDLCERLPLKKRRPRSRTPPKRNRTQQDCCGSNTFLTEREIWRKHRGFCPSESDISSTEMELKNCPRERTVQFGRNQYRRSSSPKSRPAKRNPSQRCRRPKSPSKSRSSIEGIRVEFNLKRKSRIQQASPWKRLAAKCGNCHRTKLRDTC